MNISKAIVFADLSKWHEHDETFMKLDDAAKVDCPALQWSMTEYCYKPLGITRKRISNYSACKLDIHHIMIANVFNCFAGFISEFSLNDMCCRLLNEKGKRQQIFYLEPSKTSIFNKCPKHLRETIEICANRHLFDNKEKKSVKLPEELSYRPKNVKFLFYLYDIITEWPIEFSKDLMTSVFALNMSNCSNLSFLIYIQRLVSVFKNFNKIKVKFIPDDEEEKNVMHQPKCFGPNNSFKRQFEEASEIRVCALCYTITNLYISKSYNRAKVYSDMLINDIIYTCPEKTCKYFSINLIFFDKFNKIFYPEITYIANKSTMYKIRLDTSSRFSHFVNINRVDKQKNIKHRQNISSSSTSLHENEMSCLDYKTRDFELCDGCRLLEKKILKT